MDRKEKSLVCRSKNVTFSGLVDIEDESTYVADPQNPARTIGTQRTRVTVHMPSLIARPLERWGIASIESGAQQGMDITERLLGSGSGGDNNTDHNAAHPARS